MSEVRKPKAKFGWTEERAKEAWEQDSEIAIDASKEESRQFIDSHDHQPGRGVQIDIDPLTDPLIGEIGPDELPCHLYGGDGGCLPRERPKGRLEEILQCKARAPIAESPWASFAAQVIKFTGARRAMPTTNPGEIRYAKGDHYDHSLCQEARDTVYIGVPVA